MLSFLNKTLGYVSLYFTGAIVLLINFTFLTSDILYSEPNDIINYDNDYPSNNAKTNIIFPNWKLNSPLTEDYHKKDYKKILLSLDGTNNFLDDLPSLYIISDSYMRLKDYSNALKYWLILEKTKSQAVKYIDDHIKYNIGLCYYYQKKYQSALEQFITIRKKIGINFPYFSDVLDREAKCYELLGKNKELINVFSKLNYEDESLNNLITYAMAKAYIDLGNKDEGINLFKDILYKEKEKYFPLMFSELTQLKKTLQDHVLINVLHSILITELNKDKEYVSALQVLNENIDKITDETLQFYVRTAIFKIYFRQNNLDEASKQLNAITDLSISESAIDKYYQNYIDYYKKLDNEKTIEIYKSFLEKHKISFEQKQFLRKELLNYYLKTSQNDEIRPILVNLAIDQEYTYLFNFMKDLMNDEKWKDVVELFPDAVEKIAKKNYKTKFLYFLALSKFYNNDLQDALCEFKKAFFEFTNSYYSWQAYYQLTNLSKTYPEISSQELFTQLNERTNSFLNSSKFKKRFLSLEKRLDVVGSENPNLIKAFILYSIGDMKNGNKEWAVLTNGIQKEKLNLKTLVFSEFFKKLNYFQYQISWADKTTKYLNEDEGTNYISPEIFSLAYPKYFSEIVKKYADMKQIDENLIYAVIRQESSFDKYSKSWAGALGLMQLMPATAKGMDNTLTEMDIYDEDKNINLGTRFLASLVKKFNSYSYALAGYNWGPGRVQRLLKQYETDNKPIINEPLFIENIAVLETREYVKLVMNNYFNYLAFKKIAVE